MADLNSLSVRRGVVAVMRQGERFLVIRRASGVEAPHTYCFPGGGIEDGETEVDALQREIAEELGMAVVPLVRVWQSVTPWRVGLAWWSVGWTSEHEPLPNPKEVQSIHWLTANEMLALPDLLASNRHFLEAWHRGEFSLEGGRS